MSNGAAGAVSTQSTRNPSRFLPPAALSTTGGAYIRRATVPSPSGANGGGASGPAPQQQEQPMPSRSLGWDSIVKSLLAGGVAGGVSRTAVAPLERLKILMQVQGNQKVYTGVWQGLMHMARTEGFRGMMKGNLANCIRIVPNSAVKFLTYEQLSRYISHSSLDKGGDGRMTPLLRLTAGAGAGIIAMSATYPLDMVRGRLTIQEGRGKAAAYRGITHATLSVVREEGVLALWRGWLPSVIGVIPYVGLNFAVYETSKDAILSHYDLTDERDLSVVTRLACGAFAGTFGQTVAYPLDVVRRRLQVTGWSGHRQFAQAPTVVNTILKAVGAPTPALATASGSHPTPSSATVSGWQGASAMHAAEGEGGSVAYKGMVDCFVRTVKEEGWQALFKGLWPNYVKVVPSIAIAFVTYEQLKELMGVQLRISS